MRTLAFLMAVSLAACASKNEVTREEPKPTKLEEAKEVGRMAAGLPPSNTCPPPTKKEPVTREWFGQKFVDDYAWLEDEKSPAVGKWLDAQDKCTREILARVPARDALRARFKELFYVDSVNAPIRRLNRYFYVRTHATKEKAIVYWREGEKGEEKVLLDPNGWSTDGTVSLGIWRPSWDGKKVVYAKKPNAADEATLYVLDIDSGKDSEVDVIPGTKYAEPSWTIDNKGFVYEWLPVDPAIPVDARPGYTEIRHHLLGADPAKDAVLHPALKDPTTFLGQSLSRDGKWLFVSTMKGWGQSAVKVKPFGSNKDWVVLGDKPDTLFSATAWKESFYIQTTDGAPKSRIFKVSTSKPDRKSWKEVIPEDKEATLEDWGIVGGHLSVAYLKNASSELRIHSLDGKFVRKVELPGIGSATNLVALPENDEAFFQFSSYTTPKQVYRTSVAKGGVELWAKVALPIDPTPFTVSQVHFPSKDGTQISMFIVHRKDVQMNGQNPTLLYGYGGFNISELPSFRASIYPWLEAGGIYADVNLRGGGEYGEEWHKAGIREKKQNVFDDFIAAAEYLQKEKYTSKDKLAIYGGSNGGLLVSAVMTQRPDLYGAVVCGVPLIDMLRYTHFGSGRTWIGEYGDPDVEADFKFISAYSPYQKVKAGTSYPSLLMMSSDHDDRVDPMHARKFVAAIQAASPDSLTLLRVEKNAGHGGADQVRRSIESSADLYSFLFRRFGMTPGKNPGSKSGAAGGPRAE